MDVPEAIDTHAGSAVRKQVQSLVSGDVNLVYPQVFVSYATGRRPGKDAPGCGPGMLYAQKVVDKLWQAGVATFEERIS